MWRSVPEGRLVGLVKGGFSVVVGTSVGSVEVESVVGSVVELVVGLPVVVGSVGMSVGLVTGSSISSRNLGWVRTMS